MSAVSLKFPSASGRPLRFALVGGLCAVTQAAIAGGLSRWGWPAWSANLAAFLICTQVNFALSARFTWQDRVARGVAARFRQWTRFMGSIAGTALVNQTLFLCLVPWLPVVLASAAATGCVAVVNYLLANSFVFRHFSTGAARMVTATQSLSSIHEPGTTAPVLSVIVPVFNEAETLAHLYTRLAAVLEQLEASFEILLINDGSSDGSLQGMMDLHERDPRVRVVDFSRNFGHQAAVSAGLAYAHGQAVVIIDADLQDPPETIPALVAQWRAGAEVVYAQRVARQGDTWFKRATAAVFYRLLRRLTAVNIPPDTGDFRLLDRRVVDVLVALPERHRFLRGLSAWVGFRQVAVPYVRAPRYAGETKYPLSKMLHLASDAITSFSDFPLRLASTCGFLLSGASLIGILVAVVLRLFGNAIAGQATTAILVLFLGGVQLIFLGILGAYLGRIYDEVRGRPLYVVRNVVEDRHPLG